MRLSYITESCPPSDTVSNQILVACRIARRFAHRLPTVEELRREFGMSRATAFRWRAAIKIAAGIA